MLMQTWNIMRITLRMYLSLHAREGYSAEAYEKSWLIYMDHALRNPDIFMKLIYGPYAGKLGAIAGDYYEMFPERKKQLNSDIARILD